MSAAPQVAPPTAGHVPLGAVLGHHADRHPHRTAVVCGEDGVDYAELDRRSTAVAELLVERGAAPGSTVVIGLPNGVDFFVATFATWKAGAVPLPLSSALPAPERDALIALASPSVVVGLPATDRTAVTADELAARARTGPTGATPLPARTGEQPWKVIGSGGSTGRPKLIVAGRPARTDPEQEQYTIRPGDVVLAPGPLYHQGPFIFTTAGLFLGNTVITQPSFDAAGTLELVERHGVTWAYLVPTMTHRIWRLPAPVREAARLDSLRLLVSTGAPWAGWLKRAWLEWLGPDRVLEMYGGTEEQGGLSITGRESLAHPGAVGHAHDGVRVVRPDGGPAAAGEVGELVFRRRETAGHRYVGAEASDAAWRGYGDLAHVDADGYVHLADRRTDLIVSGGVNVYPAEVESALEAHPAVVGAVVVGLPDDDLGQRVHAVVQVETPGAVDPEELRDHVRTLIAGPKAPRTIELVTESLRDDAGKVRRSAIRDARMPAPDGAR
ncbi:AMP-binding protein [Nocardioides sp. YIM 152315]|uniref:AMP-binding protein n=1 Tax=Nocardioides sp. YIM 152315 TaxID=3031760 RepID=UPI0023DB7DD6|nr:AMP-binding protein [Nocardioides sp. YIM 152315]MDF1604655.1 AMP-binding protein [Nocardioides sp. YIM 152315]